MNICFVSAVTVHYFIFADVQNAAFMVFSTTVITMKCIPKLLMVSVYLWHFWGNHIDGMEDCKVYKDGSIRELRSDGIKALIWPMNSEDNLEGDDLEADPTAQYEDIFSVLSNSDDAQVRLKNIQHFQHQYR